MRYVKQAELAELLGVTPRAIRKWHKRGMPFRQERDGTPSYPVPEALQFWFTERGSAPEEDPDDLSSISLNEAKRRREILRLQRDEEEFKRGPRDLIPREQVTRALTLLHRRIQHLPGRVARQISALGPGIPDVVRVMNPVISAVLFEITGLLEGDPEEDGLGLEWSEAHGYIEPGSR
jgi:phage terminase Nu1 subunit (DNA packaging protein)